MRRYIQNDTDAMIFIGGKMLLPGEGREFEDSLVPPEHQVPAEVPADEAMDLAQQLQGLLKAKVGEILPHLPLMTVEALAMVAQLEGESARPRSSLLAAVDAERIARADAALQAGADTVAGGDDTAAGGTSAQG